MKNNFVKLKHIFVQENLLYKTKSKSLSFQKTQATYKLLNLDDFGKKIFEIELVRLGSHNEITSDNMR